MSRQFVPSILAVPFFSDPDYLAIKSPSRKELVPRLKIRRIGKIKPITQSGFYRNLDYWEA